MPPMTVATRPVARAVHGWATVVNKRADTAGDVPVAVSRADVGVVKEVFFIAIFTLSWLCRESESVVNRAVEGGHFWAGNLLCSVKRDVVLGGCNLLFMHTSLEKRKDEPSQ